MQLYRSPHAKYSVGPKERSRSRVARLMAADRAALTAELVATLERVQGLSTQVRVPAFLSLDVTMPQAKALHLIWRQPGIRMSTLASGLGVGQSTTSGSVDRLAEMGLVMRHEDPADRRQVVLTLTDQGHETLERIHDLGAQMLRDLLGSLSMDELVALRMGIRGLVRALEERHGPQPDPEPERVVAPAH